LKFLLKENNIKGSVGWQP